MSLNEILNEIYARVPYALDIGIICGSGLSDLVAQVKDPIVIQYSELPNFPHSEVPGHRNEIVCGQIGNKNVICFRGRFHYYEGWTPKESVLGIKVMSALGVKMAIVTNAAGGLDPSYEVGDVMVIQDHISVLGFAGQNPLIGKNDEAEGPRFPSISSVYDAGLIQQFTEVHDDIKAKINHPRTLRKGCYVGLSGPNYESRHEVQMLRVCGGTAVGMSTVNEVVQAAHSGIKVLGLSLITNSCLGTNPEDYAKPEPNHEEVIEETRKVQAFVQSVVTSFVATVNLTEYKSSPIALNHTREKVAEALKNAPASSTKTGGGCCSLFKCPVASAQSSYCPFSCPMVRNVLVSTISGFLGAYAFFALKNHCNKE